MEEELTQPATQIVIDPRRLGQNNSGLNDEDLTDIFCILHPASMSAYKAIAFITEECPEHTISNTGAALKIRGENDGHHTEPGTFELAAQGLISRDLALRLSADLKNPLGGFTFGRNPQRCDFVLGNTEGTKRVSKVHFRIYINQYGVIMLEDQSMNGTVVEGVMLRGQDKDNGARSKHTLSQGSLINLVMTPPDEDIKFVVRIPQRDNEYQDMYEHNLRNHLNRLALFRQMREKEKADLTTAVATARPTGQDVETPDIFAKAEDVTQGFSDSEMGRQVREWRGGPNYNRIDKIGKGAFATVYRIASKFNGTVFAAKEIEKRRFVKNGVLDQKVDTEMKIMSKVKHPHIVQFIEHIDWFNHIYLIMEYVPGGDLGNLILSNGTLTEPAVQTMASQLLSALKYLHEKGITHRDVKPDNILIQSQHPFVVKLTDFGLSKMVDDEDTFMRTFCGTLLYCAPEVYNEYREYDNNGRRNLRGRDRKSLPPQRYGHTVDIWSLGSVLFYVLSGKPPYPAKERTTHQELLNRIMTTPLNIQPLEDTGVSEKGIRFVQSMLQTRPENRSSIIELMAMSWLGGSEGFSVVDSFDEVDLIGEGRDDKNLEQETSQLTIDDKVRIRVNDVEGDSLSFVDYDNLHRELEIPSSFKTTSDDSYAFTGNTPAQPRLFGEVNPSLIGSSGVIPEGGLNLLTSVEWTGSLRAPTGMTSRQLDESATLAPQTTEQLQLTTMQPQPGAVGGTAPSLLGAESLVGMLQMNSPSPTTNNAPSPPTEFPNALPTPDFRASMRSLRRPREGADDVRPDPKRIKSSRIIELIVPKKTFWDTRDKSTWHEDYPDMSLADYNEAKSIAQEHGEQFIHGNRVFDTIVGSYRRSSFTTEQSVHGRAQSEPTAEDGRRRLMKRDERKLEGSEEKDTYLPATSHGNLATLAVMETTAKQSDQFAVQKLSKTGFKPPLKILSKLISTPDSVIKDITLNITGMVTSWGRGGLNTIIHPNAAENRIPKYAFKLILWKPNYSATTPFDYDTHQDLSFWISTKASYGIEVNGVQIKSQDYKRPWTTSKYWGELRHGDEISVWINDLDASKFVKFRFECFWGKSKIPRGPGELFMIEKREAVCSDIDFFCLQKEHDMRRAAELEREKLEG